MAALHEIEALLNRAKPVAVEPEVIRGKRVAVATISEGVDLVYGLFPYNQRAVGFPDRLLTLARTYQPVFAVKEGDRVTTLAYAEDVEGHPLRDRLKGILSSFVPGR